MQIDPNVMEDLKAKACEILHLETLDTRNSDGLDFHDIAVWGIVDVIQLAYAAGLQQSQPEAN